MLLNARITIAAVVDSERAAAGEGVSSHGLATSRHDSAPIVMMAAQIHT